MNIQNLPLLRGLGAGSAVLLALTLAGCGSDNTSGPTVTAPAGGQGTGTLLVLADVSGTDVAPGTFQTVFTATLSDTLGAPVSGASVQVSAPGGTVPLPEDPISPGTYRATRTGYSSGTYTLSASRGSDWVSSVRVAGPALHSITSPSATDTVPAGQTLPVSWNRVSVAQEVTVETRDYVSPAAETDDGSSLVPASGNPPRDDQRVRVFRLNRTVVSGGLPGSRFEATIRNSVEPVVAR